MNNLKFVAPYLFSMIPVGIVLAGTIIIYSKTKLPATLIMLISEAVVFLAIPIQSVFLIMNINQADLVNFTSIRTVITGILTIAHLMFGIGLVLFATKIAQKKKPENSLNSI